MKFIGRILINLVLFLGFASLFPNNFHVADFKVLIVAAIVLAILETIVKPILKLFFLPINILTFGLFNLVINILMLWLTARIMGPSFSFSSFWSLAVIALLMSLCNYVITNFFNK